MLAGWSQGKHTHIAAHAHRQLSASEFMQSVAGKRCMQSAAEQCSTQRCTGGSHQELHSSAAELTISDPESNTLSWLAVADPLRRTRRA